MRVQNTGTISTLEVNRITAIGNANTYTGNLFPFSASAFIGYGSNTAQGGYYAQGTFRSTFTQVILPSLDSGIFSNIVRIQGNVSTLNQQVSTLTANLLTTSNIQTRRISKPADMGGQVPTVDLEPNTGNVTQLGYPFNGNFNGFFSRVCSVSTITSNIVHPLGGGLTSSIRVLGTLSTQNMMVSTINRKAYPARSTIGGPSFPSSFSIDGNISATPQLLISSINFFAGPGNYDISQRMVYIKQTGGNSVDAHGSILVASTNSLVSPFIDSNFGYGQIPQVNDVGHSTFTTMVTSVFIGSNSQERQYKYLDATGGNYTGILYLERPVITYIPSFGINPE
jgi:hypothetical protein